MNLWLVLTLLFLAPWVWGLAPGRRAPRATLRSGCDASGCDAADVSLGACGSSQENQKVKPGSESPWILAYVPIRSCHRILKDKYGEFSAPAYHSDSPINFWCNWTIWADSRKHIIIYIQGFITKEDCNRNEDKILFEGVSSLVESSVVYACWKKETHVFATFAQAVRVVLLKRYLPNCRDVQFKGKYYIFQDQEGDSSKDDVISETSAQKLLKQDSIFQFEWAQNLRDVPGFATTHSTISLGKTMVLNGESMHGRRIMLGTTTVGSPVELVPDECARAPLLETKAPSVLESELLGGLRCSEEAQGRGTPEGIIPTAAQDTWGQSLPASGDMTMDFGYTYRFSSGLLETPSLGALQVERPFLQPAGVGLENSRSILRPTPRLEDLDDLRFTGKPTQPGRLDWVAHWQSLSSGRKENKESTNTNTYQERTTDSLEKDESHPQSSVPTDGTVSRDADRLAMGLMPSLSGLYDMDHSLLLERSQRCQSSFGDLSITQPELGKTDLQHTKLISSPECFRAVVEGKTVSHSTAPWDILREHPHLCGQSSSILQSAPTDPGSLSQNAQAHDCPTAEKAHVSCHHQSGTTAPPGLAVPPLPTRLEHLPTAKPLFPPEKPLSSIVFSPSAALDLDSVSLRQRTGISPPSPGEWEMVSLSPPCHPSVASELGTDEAAGCLGLGMQTLVLGEVGGQQGEVSTPGGLLARGPSPASVTSPKSHVVIPWPEDHVSSGSGTAPASLPGTWGVRREEHAVHVHHRGTADNDKPASASILGGFKMQKTTQALRAGAGEWRNTSSSATPAHIGPPVAWQAERVLGGQKPQEPSDDPISRHTQVPGGQQQKHAELGPPWAVEYFPVRSCHLVFRGGSGMFYLPLPADIKTNMWCNWTILAGSQKHIVVYVQGFQGSEGCGENQDKIIFQGVSSSVEAKVTYACHNRGTLIFATQAAVVHILFLAGSGSLSQYRHFKGRYYVFSDSETVGSSDDTIAPQEPVQEVSEKERMVITTGLFPTLRASPGPSGPPAGGRIQPEHVSPEEAQHPASRKEDAQSGANLSKLHLNECDQLWDETEVERSLKEGSSEGRETKDVVVELSPAVQGAGRKAELSASEIAKEDVELVSSLATVGPCRSVSVLSSEVPSSSMGVSAKSSILDQTSNSPSEVVAAAHHMQTPVLEELPLNMSAKPSPLYPASGVTVGNVVSPGERDEELLDLASALASLENDTALQSQHHPGDMLFEVTIEIKPKDWIPRGGSQRQKDLIQSMKNHIQENLKLSANRLNEMRLKEIKRMSDGNLLLTFWLHLKPEERNVSLLLHSQLEELLGTSVGVEKLQLVSLFVGDVNECSAGLSLCGEEAECFNGVGTYLCRCKKDYEDHSPTKSGTLCIRAPRSGISSFLRHGDILVGVAITAALVMLAAAGALCRTAIQKRHARRNPSPEEPPVRPVEEPVMELHDLGECLRLEPFQLKLRARPPEWLWSARAQPGQAYQVFLEQSPPL